MAVKLSNTFRRRSMLQPCFFDTGPSISPSSGSQASLPVMPNFMDGLSPEPICTIDKPKPESIPEVDRIELKDLRYVGSYNWVDEKTPTIIVPGSPPEWQNRPTPYNVPPDTGFFFLDQNGYRMPNQVLLPLITAVETMTSDGGSPPFDWSSVDFVTDRGNFRKLLRYIWGENMRDFRIDMQLAGKKTILFNHWSEKTWQALSGRTYGLNFERASTEPAPGCGGSTGHYRIVNYDYHGLKMVVRSEINACTPRPKKRSSIASVIIPSGTTPPLSPTSDKAAAAIKVVKGGSQIPQSATIEVNTRSDHQKINFNWKEQYEQQFFSQTTHHYLAVHKRGRFTAVQKRKLTSTEFEAINKEMQPHLKGLRAILDIIKSAVIEHGQSGRLSLVCVNGTLKMYHRESRDSCLPDSTMKVFD